jgi:hypothetical protein
MATEVSWVPENTEGIFQKEEHVEQRKDERLKGGQRDPTQDQKWLLRKQR